jgi:hypothetical protein
MKKIAFIICLMFLTVWSKAQSAETEDKYPQSVLIKMIEVSNNGAPAGLESKMLVISPDNEVEKKALSDSNYLSDNSSGIESNAFKLKVEIQKWHNLGFLLKSSNVVAPTYYCIISTYILQKN